MKVKFSELSKELQKESKSILNGNGLDVKHAEFHKDGEKVVMVIKSTQLQIPINF